MGLPARRDHDHDILFTGLTRRQREVLDLLLEGHSQVAIAAHLGITPEGVKTTVGRIYSRHDVHSHPELLALFYAALLAR